MACTHHGPRFDTTARDVILATLRRVRQAGESQEMAARWICEDLAKAGFSITPIHPLAKQGGYEICQTP